MDEAGKKGKRDAKKDEKEREPSSASNVAIREVSSRILPPPEGALLCSRTFRVLLVRAQKSLTCMSQRHTNTRTYTHINTHTSTFSNAMVSLLLLFVLGANLLHGFIRFRYCVIVGVCCSMRSKRNLRIANSHKL